MEPKYKKGETVYAKSNGITSPEELIILRHVDRIYYCKAVNDPMARERVYFERELTDKKP
jgi:hypothetical protein